MAGVDDPEGPRMWQLGRGVWLTWMKPDEAGQARGIDRIAEVGGGLWFYMDDGTLLEYFYPVAMPTEDPSKVAVIREGMWEMHTAAGTSRGRVGQMRANWPAGNYLN